jgi:hypothetical protein
MINRLTWILGVLLVCTVTACSTEFKANVDNPLLVGDWVIEYVDDADALLSKELFVASAIEENYKKGNVFTFSEGAGFSLATPDGVVIQNGQYGIGVDDGSIQLNFEEGGYLLEYELIVKGELLRLEARTSGEILNLDLKRVK